MIIKARVKNKEGELLYYIAEDDKKEFKIHPGEVLNYARQITNATVTQYGTVKSKKGNKIVSHILNSNNMSIETRHTSSIGKPFLIYNTQHQQLSGTQLKILERIDGHRYCKFEKSKDNISIDMKDLAAITAYNGKELSLFARNDTYIIYMGDHNKISIPDREAVQLVSKRYKWIGHTHPGYTRMCLMPSDSDYEILKLFAQKQSVIYNSIGQFYIFGRRGPQ